MDLRFLVRQPLVVTVLLGLSGLLSATLPSHAGERLAGPVPAVVTAVIDGDTLEVRARIWLGQEIATRVRLTGVDAPEAGSRCPRERVQAAAARAFVVARLAPEGGAGPMRVRLRDIENGKYAGRVLARVETEDGTSLGAALLAAGLARAYDGTSRQPWCVAATTP